ncbi:CarD family transcriptional regulator [Paenibacillus sp. DS2015]|uniref:CarD family transcriptional regulator n=1 Tax=Paenibacillus sp. DS2015 TaxID=3373917 RepID=UPI003D1C85E5
MFNIGDLIIYSGHGICEIDSICEKTYLDVCNNYYVLHPLEKPNLTISTPVDNQKVVMLEMIHRDEAEEILESFKLPGVEWVEKNHQRTHIYSDIANKGNRKDISKVINTLMRKKHEAETHNKKFSEQDSRQLTSLQKILFTEIALSFNTTYEAVFDRAVSMINQNELQKL